jgi:acyl-CoA hydrolase
METLRPEDLTRLLRPGLRVYMPGVAGESALIVDALRRAAGTCAGVRFTGVWLPGINRVDYAGLHPEARSTAFFVGRDLRPSFAAGRVDFLPLSYFEIFRHLRDRVAIDLAVIQVAPADAAGRFSLGVAHDFTPAVLPKAGMVVAHVNPLMPPTCGIRVAPERVDFLIEGPSPILADDPAEDPVWEVIGRHVAGLIRDGDTIEVGIGRVQSVLESLTGARGLRLHSGAIGSSLLSLAGAGAIAREDGAITAGMALGGPDLHGFLADNPLVRFAPVGETHDVANLRRIARFIAINSVIEVDLLGQANAEMANGRQVSGAGGIVDFMRGARLSPEGLAIVALPATSAGGTVSRILPEFAAGTAVSVTRGDMDVVVTEHGIADLRLGSVDARAEALIGIAAPAFRDGLAEAWGARRQRM